MSPGELATLLALIRARLEDGDIRDAGSAAHYTFLPPETWARSQTVWALQRHWYYVVPLAARIRAVDAAIAEAEALEDMGATEASWAS